MKLTEADVRASVNRYYLAVDQLAESQREAVEFARGQAVAYVWGWQDGRPDTRADSYVADAFSWAYGTVAALLDGGTLTSRPSIQDAWASFTTHGAIRDYDGRAIDSVTPRQLRRTLTDGRHLEVINDGMGYVPREAALGLDPLSVAMRAKFGYSPNP